MFELEEKKQEEKKQKEHADKPPAVYHDDSPPTIRRRIWAHPWFILGVVVLAFSVIFTLMNNSDMTVNFIGVSVIIKIPMLILGCALLGAAIEFFLVIGPRSSYIAENRRLKQQIRKLKA